MKRRKKERHISSTNDFTQKNRTVGKRSRVAHTVLTYAKYSIACATAKSKKKTECRVCGYRFTPERENIYTAEEPRSALEMLTAAPTRFSAVDCPICGCQIRLADRAPRIDFPAIVERHDADTEEKEDEAE